MNKLKTKCCNCSVHIEERIPIGDKEYISREVLVCDNCGDENPEPKTDQKTQVQ